MNKKGFTLIELIVVVIVIGILATFAVPQYLKATERAKLGKAKNAIALIARAEKMYRADKDTYIGVSETSGAGTGSNFNTALGNYTELKDVDADKDWKYKVTGNSTSAFIVTATRNGGSISGSITLDQDNILNDTGFPI